LIISTKKQEYLGKFFGDLSKIIFGTVIIGQFISSSFNLTRLILGIVFLIAFLVLSIMIIPEDDYGK